MNFTVSVDVCKDFKCERDEICTQCCGNECNDSCSNTNGTRYALTCQNGTIPRPQCICIPDYYRQIPNAACKGKAALQCPSPMPSKRNLVD